MTLQVIYNPAASVLVQQQNNSAVVTQPVTRTLEIITEGPKGDPGEDGEAGAAGANGDGQYPAIAFAFGDASPSIVLTVNPASAAEITLVQLEIETPFDGAGAEIKIGTAADDDLLMRADQNAPSDAAVFEASPRVRLPAGAQVQLSITPGAGASQGSGKLIIQATPTA